jgi:hypothetical protein
MVNGMAGPRRRVHDPSAGLSAPGRIENSIVNALFQNDRFMLTKDDAARIRRFASRISAVRTWTAWCERAAFSEPKVTLAQRGSFAVR